MAAEDRYTSPVFKEAKQYVMNRMAVLSGSSEWFILSTQHYLLSPSQRIERYNKPFERHNQWTTEVIDQAEGADLRADRFVFVTGAKFWGYKERFKEWLERRGAKVYTPLRGEGRRQITWLKRQNARWDPERWKAEYERGGERFLDLGP